MQQVEFRIGHRWGKREGVMRTRGHNLFVALVSTFLLSACNSEQPEQAKTQSEQAKKQPEQAKTIDHSPAQQAKRKDVLKDLIKQGIFHKIEMSGVNGDIPVVWVAPGFYALNFEDKKTFVNVAYAYFFTTAAKSNVLLLKDSKSGKRIGSFESTFGLNLK